MDYSIGGNVDSSEERGWRSGYRSVVPRSRGEYYYTGNSVTVSGNLYSTSVWGSTFVGGFGILPFRPSSIVTTGGDGRT